MTNQLISISPVYGLQWQEIIFKTINGLDNIYDCLNYCLNIETGNCQLFTSQYGNCYLGNFGVTNGTHNLEPNEPLNGTVFTMKSNNFEFFNTSLFFYIFEQFLKLLTCIHFQTLKQKLNSSLSANFCDIILNQNSLIIKKYLFKEKLELEIQSFLTIKSNGTHWPTFIYMSLSTMENKTECGAHCILQKGPCHFYTLLNGHCFLGNVLENINSSTVYSYPDQALTILASKYS